MTPDPRIAGYLAELNQQSVVSYSHQTLRRLYQAHGTEVVDKLLAAHWEAARQANFTPMSFTPAQPGSDIPPTFPEGETP